LVELVHFGAQQVFGKKSANYTCILALKNAPNKTVRLERVKRVTRWRYGEAGEITIHNAEEFSEEPWEFLGSEVDDLFKRLKASDRITELGSVAEIFVGIQSSDDKVYILTAKMETASTVTFDDLNGEEWTVEKKILRPFLHDVKLEAFSRPVANKYIIFPYRLVGEAAEIIPESVMRAIYPRAWAYFAAHKKRLKKRSIVGGSGGKEKWYQYGRSQSLAKFNTSKIILPILSLEPRYTYDDSNIVVSGGGNGPYYLIRPIADSSLSIFYLLAVLCHPLSEAKVRTKTSVFRGGYYSHGKQFISGLFVPRIDFADDSQKAEHDTIVALAKKAIELNGNSKAQRVQTKRQLLERRVAALKAEIEERISKLFSLSSADVEVIRTVEVPR
jgi:hypothetical protein